MKKKIFNRLLCLMVSAGTMHSLLYPVQILAQEDFPNQEEIVEETTEQESENSEEKEYEEKINRIIDADCVKDVVLEQTEEKTSIKVIFKSEIEADSIGLIVNSGNARYTIDNPSIDGLVYTFVIDLRNGSYTADSLIIDTDFLSLEEPVSFIIGDEEEEEIEVQNVYYSEYDDFDYTSQTSDPDRLKVLNKGRDIISLRWTAPFDMPTWKDESGSPSRCTDIYGYTSTTFLSGHTYPGLPYTLNASGRQYDDIKWKKLLESGNYTYSTFSGSYSFSGGPTVSNTSIKGTDCSAFVSTCLNEVNTTPFYLSTYRMLSNASFVKVTGLTKEDRYNNLQPADMLLSQGHVMLYVGKDAQGWMYFFESLYPYSTVLCMAYRQSWLFDDYEAYRYNKLCDIKPAKVDTTLNDYLPIKTYGNSASITTYDVYGVKKSTITASTLFTIEEIYTNGLCKVKYGTTEAYAQTSDFLPEYKIEKKVTPVYFTTYKNSYNTTALGSMSADVEYLKVGSDGSRDCIIYNTTSGNYMGWIIPLEKQEVIHGYSLSLSGEICLNYYFQLENSFTSNANTTLVFTIGDNEQRVKLSEATKSGSDYIFTCRLSAKDMTTTIKAQFDLGNGVKGTEYKYSIEDYANEIIDNPNSYSTKNINVAKSMLTYGHHAQKYFNYHTERLPSKINTIKNYDLSAYKYVITDKNNNVEFFGARLVLGNKISLKLYFKDKGAATFKLNGTTAKTTTEENGKYRVITISNITSLNKLYTITTTNFTLKYYVLSYGNGLTVEDNQKIYNLMQSLYDFYLYYNA